MGKLVKNGIDYTNGTVDSVLSNTSKNPVQNKVVTGAINNLIAQIGGLGGVSYSYDEQAVGTWVDGSTIYKKTFHSGYISTNGSYTIPKETGWHVGTYVKSEVIMQYADSAYNLVWASNVGNENVVVATQLNANDGSITFFFRSSYGYSDSYVTIYYTKEADT